MQRRLPPDNFPDDTETHAFQNYDSPTFRRLTGLYHGRRWLLPAAGFLVTAVVVILVMQWVMNRGSDTPDNTPVSSPTYPTPRPDPLQLLNGDFPSDITDRQSILVPARIDDTLPAGNQRGYVFYAPSTTEWCIIVEADAGLPSISLYGPPDGVFTSTVTGAALTATFQEDSLYAVVVGNVQFYTLLILPVDYVGGIPLWSGYC